jgi:glycosyltransferase involved in cell wall biosynthesis
LPRVSIGLPVYNGENYLEDAIRSVLSQTEGDLELVIADNASVDRTAEIVQDHAAADPRIRYVRQERNLGAAANYNRTWQESRGTYFKWLSHDDRLTPTYVAATTAALDAAPDAVLCNSIVDYIDEHGRVFAAYDSDLKAASVGNAAQRFAAMVLRSHSCVDFFAMLRRDAMVGSRLHGSFHGADRVFLAQMALRGRLLQLPGHLVQMREHPHRYTRQQADANARRVWHDSSARRAVAMPTLRVYRDYVRLVGEEKLSLAERRGCYAVLARWWVVNWNAARVGTDAVSLVAPGVVGQAERLKTRLFGAAPGHFMR